MKIYFLAATSSELRGATLLTFAGSATASSSQAALLSSISRPHRQVAFLFSRRRRDADKDGVTA